MWDTDDQGVRAHYAAELGDEWTEVEPGIFVRVEDFALVLFQVRHAVEDEASTGKPVLKLGGLRILEPTKTDSAGRLQDDGLQGFQILASRRHENFGLIEFGLTDCGVMQQLV